MAIKLTPKLIRKSRLSVSPEWVSNGHWLIQSTVLAHRDQVLVQYPEAASVVYGVTVETLKDGVVQKVFDRYFNELTTYHSTEWHYANGLYYRTNDDGDPTILLDNEYVKQLNVQSVYAQASDEVAVFNRDENPTVVLMPMRGQTQIPAWVEEEMKEAVGSD